jgi:hypothetical protein
MRRFLMLAPISALLLTGLAPARAQSLNGPMVPEGTGQQRPAAAPPPALPGLAGRTRAPIPAEPGTENLAPNEALFDAINRGDMAAARDAAARGADMNARNVLGLTPLDSAVDQGRNDIAFFLLSARGGGGLPADMPAAAASGTPLTAPPLRGRAPGRNAARETPTREAPTREVPAREAVRSPAATRAAPAPRYGASDGGSPQPSQGFLGFDAGRSGGG